MEDDTTLLFDPVAASQSSVSMAMRSILEFTTGRCIQKAAGLSSETAGQVGKRVEDTGCLWRTRLG